MVKSNKKKKRSIFGGTYSLPKLLKGILGVILIIICIWGVYEIAKTISENANLRQTVETMRVEVSNLEKEKKELQGEVAWHNEWYNTAPPGTTRRMHLSFERK